MTRPIEPGATLGVLGGGQLGRMFAIEARRLGYRVAVLAPDEDCPAGQVADRTVVAAYDDLDAVEGFARSVAAVTTEFENVPSRALEVASQFVPVRPGADAIAVAQDRLREKRSLQDLGLPVAPYSAIVSEGDLDGVRLDREPHILKTSGSGYDGKGQRRVASDAELRAAWDELGRVPCVLEQVVPFDEELSVVGARGADGAIELYDPILNRHVNHVLDVSLSPAPVPPSVSSSARALARTLLEGLDYVGVLCVELFLLRDGELVANEIAPRPHNSGHLTIEGHACSQFEQQVRALCGMPLGSTRQVAPGCAMANLLGDLWQGGTPAWERALAQPGVSLHLYGKDRAKPGRKMGHLTATASTVEAAERAACHARAALTEGSPVPAGRPLSVE